MSTGRPAASRTHRAFRQLETTGRVVRGVLRSPALRRVALAFLLFAAVEFGTWIAILLYAYRATGSTSVGIVALVQLGPAAVVAPLAAALGDRFPRHRVLLAGYLVQTLACLFGGIGMIAGWPPAAVYAVAAVAASSFTLTRPTQGSLLPGLARTPEELTAANGLSGAVEGVGLLVGPLGAAAVLVVASPGAVFLVGAAALAVASILVAGVHAPAAMIWSTLREHGHADAAPTHEHAGFLDGARVLLTSPRPRLVVGLLALRSVTLGALDVLFVLLALEVLGTGESGAGVLNAALGLGTILGGALAFALVGRPRLGPALVLSALGWAATAALVAAGAPTWAVPVLIALGGIGSAVYDVAGRTILQRVTPHRVLAGVLGGLEGISTATMGIGSLLVPTVAALGGVRAAVAAAGFVLPAGAIAAWWALRRIDATVEVPVRALRLLRLTPIFAPLPPPQLESVGRRVRWVTAEPGEAIIREGDAGDRFYVLESGTVRVTQGGRELRTLAGPGPGFGEIALLRDVPRTATVTASEHCVLLALERVDFLEAMTGDERARAVGESIVDRHQGGARHDEA